VDGNEGPLDRKARAASTRWVTRERPKIDRIACPWLISRFVDRDAEFLYVPSKQVRDVAIVREAVPYDVPGGPLHAPRRALQLRRLHQALPLRRRPGARAPWRFVVRGADTAKLDLAPQAPGLAAVSLGLSRIFPDDHEMLKHGMVLYDALYAWCKDGQDNVTLGTPKPIVKRSTGHERSHHGAVTVLSTGAASGVFAGANRREPGIHLVVGQIQFFGYGRDLGRRWIALERGHRERTEHQIVERHGGLLVPLESVMVRHLQRSEGRGRAPKSRPTQEGQDGPGRRSRTPEIPSRRLCC